MTAAHPTPPPPNPPDPTIPDAPAPRPLRSLVRDSYVGPYFRFTDGYWSTVPLERAATTPAALASPHLPNSG